jgi:hypothetical protein
MNLRIFILSLNPENPAAFSLAGLRRFLNNGLQEYTAANRKDMAGFIHRYPALQCRQAKTGVLVVGIAQGADFLHGISADRPGLGSDGNACTITRRDPLVREEPFGTAENPVAYEFLTSYLALNQQNQKKFYDLKGKEGRDAFLQMILAGHLATLAKSLDYIPDVPVTCTAKLRFRHERVGRENAIVFYGRFSTNLSIPDNLGIGQSVAQGYGAVCRSDPGVSDGNETAGA